LSHAKPYTNQLNAQRAQVESEGDAWINAALWFDTAASAN
jgi:hypothetical protein